MSNLPEIQNLAHLIDRSAQLYGPRELFGQKVKTEWHWITYSSFQQQVERLRAAFDELGMKEGDRVAIISNNSIPFALTAYAAYGLGAVVVPMYEVQKPEDWRYIICDSGARFVFTGNDKIKAKIEGMHLDQIDHLISYRPETPEGIEAGVEAMIRRHETGLSRRDIAPETLADILYTSGTTGNPKGVELTHRNIVQNAIYTFDGFDASCKDRSLSFLPWAHAFGKTVELHIFPYFGASIAIAESARTIATDLLEVHPTILNGVPKIFNKFYDSIQSKASENLLSEVIFKTSDKLSLKARKERLSLFEKAGQMLLNRAIGPKIHRALGGKLRFCISGGAPLSVEVMNFFNAYGITIFEGYGMTETSPIIAVNKHGHIKFGSVGRVLDCNKVEIVPCEDHEDGQTGEVVVSGDCIMKCYHNREELTREVLDDGKFHSGDLGYIDKDGYLFITGRVKEQYKLENGKYVVPGALEEKLNRSHAIEHAVIFGSGRPYNIALIRPTDAFIEKYRSSHKLEKASQSELESDEGLCQAIMDEVRKISADFRGYEKPQRIAVVLDEFSVQNGLLSVALKLRRRELEKRYNHRIDALYK